MTKQSVIILHMPRVAAKDREAFVEGRRTEIVEAAVASWAAHGVDGTTMAAIAERVGLTKGTLYLYFPSKDALLEEVMRRFSLRPDVEGVLEALRDQPLEQVIRMLVAAAWSRLRERRDLVSLALRELPGQLPHAKQFLAEVMVPTTSALAAFLEEKLPPGRAETINTLVAARGLISMVVIYFVSQEMLGGSELLPIPEHEATATIVEVFLNGVRGGPAA